MLRLRHFVIGGIASLAIGTAVINYVRESGGWKNTYLNTLSALSLYETPEQYLRIIPTNKPLTVEPGYLEKKKNLKTDKINVNTVLSTFMDKGPDFNGRKDPDEPFYYIVPVGSKREIKELLDEISKHIDNRTRRAIIEIDPETEGYKPNSNNWQGIIKRTEYDGNTYWYVDTALIHLIFSQTKISLDGRNIPAYKLKQHPRIKSMAEPHENVLIQETTSIHTAEPTTGPTPLQTPQPIPSPTSTSYTLETSTITYTPDRVVTLPEPDALHRAMNWVSELFSSTPDFSASPIHSNTPTPPQSPNPVISPSPTKRPSDKKSFKQSPPLIEVNIKKQNKFT